MLSQRESDGHKKMQTVMITGADRGIGFAMCELFAEHGWRVFAGRFLENWKELDGLKERFPNTVSLIPLDVGNTESVREAAGMVAAGLADWETGALDMLINCAGIAGGNDPEAIRRLCNVNSVGALRMTEAFLPLMEKGAKRLCYVSSEAGCISLAHRQENFAYCMSKSALNMAVRLLFNKLRPEGYTFRLYHPGWVNSYMGGDTKSTKGKFEPEDAARTAYGQFTQDRDWEDALVMMDVRNEAWPF